MHLPKGAKNRSIRTFLSFLLKFSYKIYSLIKFTIQLTFMKNVLLLKAESVIFEKTETFKDFKQKQIKMLYVYNKKPY